MTPFRSHEEAVTRLQDNTPLLDEEARALFQWLRHASEYMPRIQTDLALQQISAINRFNEASGKLTKAAIVFAAAQVIVGLIALIIALLHRAG